VSYPVLFCKSSKSNPTQAKAKLPYLTPGAKAGRRRGEAGRRQTTANVTRYGDTNANPLPPRIGKLGTVVGWMAIRSVVGRANNLAEFVVDEGWRSLDHPAAGLSLTLVEDFIA
jgi:hypothetical protein